MNIKLLVLLLISPLLYSQINLKNNTFKLNEFNDQLTIDQVIEKDVQGLFNENLPLKTYRFLKDKEANWIKIDVPKQKEKQYISIENSLFEELRFYIYQNTKISIPDDLKDENQYRFPLIAIYPEQTPCQVFIRSKDALSYRTEFIIRNYSEATLQKAIQADYFTIGGYLAVLIVLLIYVCFFFLYKKEYTVLWYGLYVSVLSVNYLISTGTFSQWVVANKFILKYGLDHISMFIGVMALSEFYRSFYPFTAKTLYCRKIYFWITLACAFGALFSIIDGLTGNQMNVEYYALNLLNCCAATTLILHVILLYNKVIPGYIFIAFLLPVLGVFVNNGEFKEQFDNPKITYFLFQSVYYAILIEVIIIFFYITKESLDVERKAVGLTKENNKLKYNFQESLSANQEKQQNAILSDVHDSFGGYIEALKLTLLNKNIKETAVDDILSSFTKDYRLLLNSLYVPNVDTENFITAIQEYCEKMNNLSEIDISFNYSNEKYIEIPQNIAKFIFKASSELTTNSIKYAKPSYIKVDLTLDPTFIILQVKDDGIGFAIDNIKNSSYGINGIKERVSVFNGKITIDSEPNKGTSIDINIPIPESLD